MYKENNSKDHIRNLYAIVSGHRSLARQKFNKLLPGQKRLLLYASGISDFNTATISFESLSDDELNDISKGINRLRHIVLQFDNCEPQDFIKGKNNVRQLHESA